MKMIIEKKGIRIVVEWRLYVPPFVESTLTIINFCMHHYYLSSFVTC